MLFLNVGGRGCCGGFGGVLGDGGDAGAGGERSGGCTDSDGDSCAGIDREGRADGSAHVESACAVDGAHVEPACSYGCSDICRDAATDVGGHSEQVGAHASCHAYTAGIKGDGSAGLLRRGRTTTPA